MYIYSTVYTYSIQRKKTLSLELNTLYTFSGWHGSDGTKDFILLDPSQLRGPLTTCTLVHSVRRCAMGTAAVSMAQSASVTQGTLGQPAK